MRSYFRILILTTFLLCNYAVKSQTDSANTDKESVQSSILKDSLAQIEQQRIDRALKKKEIDSLRNRVLGFPVIINLKDTLFVVRSNIGESTPKERASNITKKIKKLQKDDFLKIDSIVVVKSINTYDIVYGETVIIKISVADAIWYDKSAIDLANELSTRIKDAIVEARTEHSLIKVLQRIGLAVLVLMVLWLIIRIIKRGKDEICKRYNKRL